MIKLMRIKNVLADNAVIDSSQLKQYKASRRRATLASNKIGGGRLFQLN